MTGRLEGGVVILTGATKGIGAETARVLAREGTAVVATGRDEGGGQAVVEEIARAGGGIRSTVAATREASDDALFHAAAARAWLRPKRERMKKHALNAAAKRIREDRDSGLGTRDSSRDAGLGTGDSGTFNDDET